MYQAPFQFEDRRIDPSQHPLQHGLPPGWASGWGQDEFGVFAELTVSDVTQKLRWIPPGKFMLGSPEDEPGRFDDEGPRHEVTIASGFWLFDTPVTQALWQAVMTENPSQFEDLDRPVEQISWNDAQDFVDRLNKQVSGIELGLPGEAEWEYACRAGTDGATYAGSLSFDDDEADHAILDRIAWYERNSRTETHPVGQKEPNGFGLYDMLGNVYEWCADEWHNSYAGAPADSTVWQDQSIQTDKGRRALRVVRGGSWYGSARSVRSAYRLRAEPSARDNVLGFRCAVRSG